MHDANVAVGSAAKLCGIESICAEVPHWCRSIQEKCRQIRSGAARCARTKITRSSSGKRRRELRAFLPGGEVMLLLRSELVEPVPHGFELKPRDLFVQVLRHYIHLRL